MKLTRRVLQLVLTLNAAVFLAGCADMQLSDRDSGYGNYGSHSGHSGHH